MSDWTEVADAVFVRRYTPWDVNVAVVRCPAGLVVVDTRASRRQGAELRADLRQFGPVPVRAVVNTHAHFDHCFGNSEFGATSDIAAPIYGHAAVPAHLAAVERARLEQWSQNDDASAAEWRETRITPPTVLVQRDRALHLGRDVRLLHVGRGHTDNDLIVSVPDAHCWLAGDLVEESGPPSYDLDSFPLDWPRTLTELGGLLDTDAVVVPGHGAPVDCDFLLAQREQVQRVAVLVRELYAGGTRVVDAAAAAERWPFAAGGALAVRAGYLQLRAAGAERGAR